MPPAVRLNSAGARPRDHMPGRDPKDRTDENRQTDRRIDIQTDMLKTGEKHDKTENQIGRPIDGLHAECRPFVQEKQILNMNR